MLAQNSSLRHSERDEAGRFSNAARFAEQTRQAAAYHRAQAAYNAHTGCGDNVVFMPPQSWVDAELAALTGAAH